MSTTTTNRISGTPMATTQTDRFSGSSTTSPPGTDLAALEALSGSGLAARTAENTWALRSLTVPAAGISVTFADGVSGNPTLALANDLAALEGLASTGIAVRSAADTWVQRSVAATAPITVANASGAAGNPTLGFDITVLTADASPDGAADYVVTYDASAATYKKVLLNNLAGSSAAAQSDQETASSTTTFVSPGRQQFHPSAAKCWINVTVTTGTPAISASYNITSITDTGVGSLTVTIATDFSSGAWASVVTSAPASAFDRFSGIQVQAAGSALLYHWDITGGALADPLTWSLAGFGDQ